MKGNWKELLEDIFNESKDFHGTVAKYKRFTQYILDRPEEENLKLLKKALTETEHYYYNEPNLVNKILENRNERQINVLLLRYGIEDGKIKTFNEIGEILNISKSRAAETARRAIMILRNQKIKIFLNLSDEQIYEMTAIPIQKFNKTATPIEELGLGVRAYNCLKNNGVNTVQQLIKLSSDEIQNIRNAGIKTCIEIIEKRDAYLAKSFNEENETSL